MWHLQRRVAYTARNLSQGKREQNNTPSQALLMLNNDFIINKSDKLANKVIKMKSGKEERIREIFLLCFSRTPTKEEMKSSLILANKFFNDSAFRRKSKEDKEMICLSVIAQSLFASAEFRYRY